MWWERLEHFHHFLFVFVYDLNLFFFGFVGFLIIAPQPRRCHLSACPPGGHQLSSRPSDSLVQPHTLSGMRPTPSVSHCQFALFAICSALLLTFPSPLPLLQKRKWICFIYSVPLHQKTNISPLCPIQNATPLSSQGSPFKIKCTFLFKTHKSQTNNLLTLCSSTNSLSCLSRQTQSFIFKSSLFPWL